MREENQIDDMEDYGVDSDQDTEYGEQDDDEEPIVATVGETMDCTKDGHVTKEVLQVGKGLRPKLDYQVFINYRSYFFKDHLIFDQGQNVEIFIDDPAWPRGIHEGLQAMRKGEKAKVKIKKDYGYGFGYEKEKIAFPKDYAEEGSENRERLLSETFIFEVELLEVNERSETSFDGGIYKYPIRKPDPKFKNAPTGLDEIEVEIIIQQ